MSETVRIIISPDSLTTVGSYCLKTDSWQDYLAFKEDVKLAVLAGDGRKINRCLRAALINLFSHFEAVVLDIEKKHPKLKSRRRLKLYEKTILISREARKYKRIPPLNFRTGKHLRDIIAHPGIEMNYAGRRRKLDFVSLFDELDLATLEKLETRLVGWLDAVCDALRVERLSDTKKTVEDLSKAYGSSNEIQEI